MLSSQSKKKKSSKMMGRRERGEVLEIPLDLQIEIVNRLPIKSLARFKCVSKLWCSLICSKGYIFPSPPRLFISLVEENSHKPVKSVLLSLASTSSTTFDLDTRKKGMGAYNMAVFRGLILLNAVCGQACIYNPTTGQRVTLPAIESNILAEEEKEMMKKLDFYFFGYDPVLDQYKVVCSSAVVWSIHPRRIDSRYWVLLLESGSSWKRIKCDHPHIPTRRRLCINGVIYYFATNITYGDQFMSFDVRSEEFSMIQLPHAVSEIAQKSVGLIEYGRKPTIFDYTNLKDSSVNLWVLEDTGQWSLVLQTCQMHFFPNTMSFDFEVIGTIQNGKVVLQPRLISYPCYILYYDLHKKDLRRVDIRGISNHHKMDPDKRISHLGQVDIDTCESIMHLKI